jgi:uncharacterized protein involved in exopolysaccharide biosynthesis
MLRHRKTILITAACTVIVAFGLSFLQSDVYTTHTVLLMQQDEGSRVDGLAARVSGLAGGGGSSARLVTAVLSSRSLADTLARRVGRAAKREVQPDLERGNTLTIHVTDPDPVRAARVANAYAEVVNRFVAQISHKSTERKQQFLATQVALARERLERAEQRTVAFQRGQDAPEIQEQARLSLTAAVELQRDISNKEIQISQLRRTATANNPELRRLIAEVGLRREQLRRLTAGGGSGSVLPALRQSSELKLTSARLLREYTEAEEIYSSLAASLAQAQITASNHLPVLTVLDPALVPTVPKARNRALLLILAAILGLAAGAAFALGSEYLRARRDPKGTAAAAEWDGNGNGSSSAAGGRAGILAGDQVESLSQR